MMKKKKRRYYAGKYRIDDKTNNKIICVIMTIVNIYIYVFMNINVYIYTVK